MLVLYHAPHSTCSQKVRLVLHEKGVKFDEVRIDLAKKEQLKPDYLKLNPNGVVPTLVDDGVPIVELSVICEYLDEKYPQNPLVPSDIVERARMRAWMHYIEEVAVGAIRVPSFNRAFLYRFNGLDQKQFEAQEINPRPVRKELFQRMGSPKGFSRDRNRQIARRTVRDLPPHGRGNRRQRPLADGRTVHARRRTGDAEHRSDGGSRARLDLARTNIRASANGTRGLQERPAFKATYFPGSRVSDFLKLEPLYAAERG